MHKLTRVLLLLAICGSAFAIPAAAQPTTTPTTKPAKPSAAMTLPQLELAAISAFDAGDYATALPLLKDLSVRQRNFPDKVGPLLEKVRVCEANLAQQVKPIEGINAPRTPHPRPTDGQPYEVALTKLGNFEFDADKGGNIPDDVKALAGATLKLTGFMIPIEEADKITKFVLVPDLFACCFGQPPQLQHTAVVICPPGKSVNYYPEEISVVGELKVEEKRDEGFITSLFEIRAVSIRPVAK